MKRPLSHLTVVAAAVLTNACGLAMMAPVVVEGQAFPCERVPELRSSMTPVEVEAVLGSPLREVHAGQSRVWVFGSRIVDSVILES
jgi:hypothetical protein